ncbi:hypothetical protein D3C85_1706470 [compost metagenome]
MASEVSEITGVEILRVPVFVSPALATMEAVPVTLMKIEAPVSELGISLALSTCCLMTPSSPT